MSEVMGNQMETKSVTMNYAEAIRLALSKRMENERKTLVYGLGVDDPKAMYGTLKDFPKIYGEDRCFDTPLSEDCMTGFGIGMALSGYYPIHVHQRTDFLLLCCNQLINMAAKIRYLSNGQYDCPLIIRAITGRSWGQGSQHSQSLHSMFANIPGLVVLTPATANDAYNSYMYAHESGKPTIIIEHRMLYNIEGKVRDSGKVPSTTRLTKGEDITICTISHMTVEGERAVKYLRTKGIRADHFSIVNNTELELEEIRKSAIRTNKLLIVDHGWLNASVADTIISKLHIGGYKGKTARIGYGDSPCPTARNLEYMYYPNPNTIATKCMEMLNMKVNESAINISPEVLNFKGPF